MAALARSFHQHNLVVTGPALVQIPELGGLDAARLLIVAGTVLVAAVLARILWRSRRRQIER